MMRYHDTARVKSTTREHESSWTLTQTACSTRFILDERVVTSEKFSEKNVPSWLSEYGELRAHGLQTNLILNNFKQFRTISNTLTTFEWASTLATSYRRPQTLALSILCRADNCANRF